MNQAADDSSSDRHQAPPAKRQRLDGAAAPANSSKTTGDDDEDNIDLSGLVDGDVFITKEQKQEAESQRRREKRRERLRKMQQQQQEETSNDAKLEPPTETSVVMKVEEKTVNAVSLTKVPTAAGVASAGSIAENNRKLTTEESDDANEFDMFSSSVSPVIDQKKDGSVVASATTASSRTTKRGHEQEDWDDAEGYYKDVIGEIISLKSGPSSSSSDPISLRVAGVIGKGVFSTVLKCTTVSNSSSIELPPTVALKCIRHNETMAKAALNELHTLQKLKGSPGIVPLLMPTHASSLEHRGHVIMVFSFMEYNLRDVLQKFGKGVGISLQAVRSYFGQLLAAATHLKKHGVIHLDLKPDNILVSSDFSAVSLADFGSAIHVASPEQSQVTPYMVSRFYRAPEIILGMTPTHGVDLWSLAVTVAEIFLGDVVFRGKSNNDMLYDFMQHLGAFSNRVIRQHLVLCQRFPVPRHFEPEKASFVFRQQTVDPVSGAAVHKFLSLIPHNNNGKFPLGTPLKQKLLKAKSASDSKKLVLQFAALLEQCLALDPTRRIALKDALRHPFFQANTSAAKTNNSNKD